MNISKLQDFTHFNSSSKLDKYYSDAFKRMAEYLKPMPSEDEFSHSDIADEFEFYYGIEDDYLKSEAPTLDHIKNIPDIYKSRRTEPVKSKYGFLEKAPEENIKEARKLIREFELQNLDDPDSIDSRMRRTQINRLKSFICFHS